MACSESCDRSTPAPAAIVPATARRASAATRPESAGRLHRRLGSAGRSASSARPIRSAKTRPSSREFDASRLAPCTPVQATSPQAYRPGTLGAAIEVGADPAAGVVAGGRDRDQVDRRVEAAGLAGLQDGREAVLPAVAAQVPAVEPHVRGARLAHAPHDRLGDHVARREVGQLVLPLHEAHPGVVDEEGALAAHRLGDQRLLAAGGRPEVHHGGVELHELEVGDPRPRAQRQGHAVAGRDRRVGRLREDLAHAAGRQDDGAREHRADAVRSGPRPSRAGWPRPRPRRRTAAGRGRARARSPRCRGRPGRPRPGRGRSPRPWRRRRRGRCDRGGGRPRG